MDPEDSMKLSVIVPTLNGGLPKGLPEPDDDIEIVFVSGISPVGRARNEGVRRAKGDYIAWVDADDEILPSWRDEIFAAMKADADVIVLDVEGVGWTRFHGGRWNVPGGLIPHDRLMRDIYAEGALAGAMWQFVSRRTLWNDLRFDETVEAWEDYILLHVLCSRAKKVWHIAKSIYRYINQPGSLVNTSSPEKEDRHIASVIGRAGVAESKWKSDAVFASARECYWVWRRSRNGLAWRYVAKRLVLLACYCVAKRRIRWAMRFVGMTLGIL